MKKPGKQDMTPAGTIAHDKPMRDRGGDHAGKTALPLPEGLKNTVAKVPSPSPNPMTNVLLADIALRAGGQLLRHAVERGILGVRMGDKKAKSIVKGRSLAQTLVGTAIARMATRSVPGALVVGGSLLAKTLYDRRRGHKARTEGEQALEEQVAKGEKS